MKRRTSLTIMLLIIIPLFVCAVQAETREGGRQKTVDKARASSAGGKSFRSFIEGKRAQSKRDTGSSYYYASPLKDARLSYQESLTLPVKGSYACKDETQLRVLAGMHGFDINYALVFGRKKEFVNTMKFLNSEISGRLKASDYINPNISAAEEIKALLADLKDPQNIEKFRACWSKQFETNLKKADADPKIMQQLLDQGYGAIIESSFILCNLALNSADADKLYSLFIDYMLRVDALDIKMQQFYNSDYGKALEQSDRKNFLPPIRDLIAKKHGLLDRKDIKFILDRVKKVRTEFVKPCK